MRLDAKGAYVLSFLHLRYLPICGLVPDFVRDSDDDSKSLSL